jgi:hypothetical protein
MLGHTLPQAMNRILCKGVLHFPLQASQRGTDIPSNSPNRNLLRFLFVQTPLELFKGETARKRGPDTDYFDETPGLPGEMIDTNKADHEAHHHVHSPADKVCILDMLGFVIEDSDYESEWYSPVI